MNKKIIVLALVCVAFSACGGSAKVNLRFTQGTGSGSSLVAGVNGSSNVAAGTPAAVDEFKMKLLAAYLAEDIDAITQNNTGKTEIIWLNTECAGDISNCDVGGSLAHIVSTFFDFSSAVAAQAALNSQNKEVATGTYKYVRLEFCKSTPTSPNIKWASSAATVTEQSFAQSSCSVNSAVFNPPLSVEKGKTVTVTLAYNLAAAATVYTGGPGTGGSCATVGGNSACFNVPAFNPSASVQ